MRAWLGELPGTSVTAVQEAGRVLRLCLTGHPGVDQEVRGTAVWLLGLTLVDPLCLSYSASYLGACAVVCARKVLLHRAGSGTWAAPVHLPQLEQLLGISGTPSSLALEQAAGYSLPELGPGVHHLLLKLDLVLQDLHSAAPAPPPHVYAEAASAEAP